MKARENPYRSEQILKIRYRFQTGSLSDVLDGLRRLRYRAALVGPEGSGKTTLMEDLQQPLLAEGWNLYGFRLTREFPQFSPEQQDRLRQGFTGKDFLFFDGAEILGRLRFLHFRHQVRHAGGLLITTHQPGYLPTLLRSQTTPSLLAGIIETLDPGFTPPSVPALFHRHRGNLREALRELYDLRPGLSASLPSQGSSKASAPPNPAFPAAFAG